MNKSLTSGFQNFFMVWLGRAEITPIAICSKLIKASNFVFALPIFMQKERKTDTLKKLLQNDVINLETLLCPKVENLKLYRDIPIVDLLAVSCPKQQQSRHCATKKAKLFYQGLTNESPFGKINSISP